MRRALIVAGSTALLLFAFFVPSAAAEDQYLTSRLTFSGPIRIPGATLPAGTYVFRRVVPGVIQVLSDNRATAYSMFMTIPRYRSEPTEKHEVVLGEAPANVPPPMEVWFLPWRTIGYEFLYPKPAAHLPARVATN